MQIDAHQHFWRLDRGDYAWLTPALAPIHRDFLPADLEPILSRHSINATILVQAAPTIAETLFLLSLAVANSFIAGVVGWVDLTAGVPRQLAHLRSLPGGDKLAGIRHQVQDEGDPHWLERDDVLAGIDCAGDAGLAYDLLVHARHLPSAEYAAKMLPHVRFVLDHGAKPPIAGGGSEAWRTGIARLAALPNVSCKLSGFITEAVWATWRAAEILPYMRYLLESFGAHRMMYGSDWPVCLLAGTYDDVLTLAKDACSQLDAAESRAIFSENAIRIYRLEGMQ